MTTFQKLIKGLAMAFAIILIIGIFSGIANIAFAVFGGYDSNVGDMSTYSVSGEVKELDVSIDAAELQIKTGDAFGVESNLKNLTVREENGRLTLEEKNSFWSFNSGSHAVLVITVPQSLVFDRASINTGAGRVTVERLASCALSLELGAGEAVIESLTATQSADIDGGAGRIEIKSGELANLDLDMGVGELVIKSRLSGECELDLGVGATDITLVGTSADYTLDFDKGLGDISVDGISFGDGAVVGTGECEVDVNGGIGAIKVSFAE